MNGATARNPAPARAGSRCRQVWAASGNPCRHSASGPDPASSTPNSRPFARTVADRTANEASTAPSYPCQLRSEEHTSELQSRLHLVCRLLLEKKKKNKSYIRTAKKQKKKSKPL